MRLHENVGTRVLVSVLPESAHTTETIFCFPAILVLLRPADQRWNPAALVGNAEISGLAPENALG